MTDERPSDRIASLLGPYLGRQSWYWSACALRQPAAATEPAPTSASGAEGEAAEAVAVDLSLTVMEVLAPPPEPPQPASGPASPAGLARLLVQAGECALQVLIGWREATAAAGVLRGRESAILGALPASAFNEEASIGSAGDVLVYDALADEEMLLAILSAATEGKETARRARIVESLTSHASVVYDERLFMKIYRVLEPAPRPEVDIMLNLDEVGFNNIVAPVALWRGNGYDLALIREFYGEATEGRTLALTSLRDLFGTQPGEAGTDPAERAARAGGDMAAEMRRLGDTTARMHEALAKAYGSRRADLVPIADALQRADPAGGAQLAARLRAMEDPGAAIRVQGDYHLRRVMRSDMGWLVAGFGDDPSRYARLGPEGRGALDGLPADDIADMLLAIRAVADEALSTHHPEDPGEASLLAVAWVERNGDAFLEGYLSSNRLEGLNPPREDLADLVAALELLRVSRAGRG